VGDERDVSTARFDGRNIVALQWRLRNVPKPFIRNASRNGYKTDAP
jgi:hypothetical protein